MSGSFVEVTDAAPVSQGPFWATSGGTFDTSNWTVATSGSKANGSASAIPQWALYAAAAVAVLWALKRMKRG